MPKEPDNHPQKQPAAAPPAGPSPFARGPTGMSGAVTAFLSITLLALLFGLSFLSPSLDRAASFERAPETVARVFERRLELAAALDALPAWERSLITPFVPVDIGTAGEAALAFRRVIEVGNRVDGSDDAQPKELASEPGRDAREVELDGLRARRALLLAEGSRIEEAQGDLDELTQRGHVDFVAAARALSSGRARAEDLALALAGDGWIGRSAVARARGEPPPTPGAEIRRTLAWARGLAGVVGLGILVLLAWLARNRPDVYAASVPIPSAWSPQTGFAVLVRAAFACIAISLAIEGAAAYWENESLLIYEAALASLPLFVLVRKHLARPHRMDFIDLVGFPAVRANVLLSTLALFALVEVGGRALGLGALAMGASEPWTYQVDEFDIWSSDGAFAFAAFGSLAFAVVGVELAFRGVLFPSLRHVHGPRHAALLSGMLYAAVQFASLPAMLALAWGGFAAALSVERTRCVLPAILCMALQQFFEIALLGSLYR